MRLALEEDLQRRIDLQVIKELRQQLAEANAQIEQLQMELEEYGHRCVSLESQLEHQKWLRERAEARVLELVERNRDEQKAEKTKTFAQRAGS